MVLHTFDGDTQSLHDQNTVLMRDSKPHPLISNNQGLLHTHFILC